MFSCQPSQRLAGIRTLILIINTIFRDNVPESVYNFSLVHYLNFFLQISISSVGNFMHSAESD